MFNKKIMLNKMEQKLYDLGYQAGYDKGLEVGKLCANCEDIKDCPDFFKANYCPHSGMNCKEQK